MAEAVYILCAATSLACTVMLVRGYLRSRASLLLWSSVCFVGLAANNALLLVELLVVQDVDLMLWRHGSALVGLVLLVYGLILGVPGRAPKTRP